MGHMFNNAKNFRGTGVGLWNTAKTTTMSAMFLGATLFNADLGNINGKTGIWKTGSVSTMGSMFRTTDSFTGFGLAKFDISTMGTTGFVNMFLDANGITSCSKRGMLDAWKTSTFED